MKVWMDCEGLHTAVKMQLDTTRAYLSDVEASRALCLSLTAPALHSCLKMPPTKNNKGSFNYGSIADSSGNVSVGSTPRSARSARFADENGGSVEIGPSEPSTPGREGKKGGGEGEGVSIKEPEGRMVLSFEEYVGEWLSRITDLHHLVNAQEGERYMTALRLGEREARLLLRRLKGSEYREDKAHRELNRLSQLEALILNGNYKGGGGGTRAGRDYGAGGGSGSGYVESLHSSDGGSGFLGRFRGESQPSNRLGSMGTGLGAAFPGSMSSLFESQSLSSNSPSLYDLGLSQSHSEWGDNGSQMMIDSLTQMGREGQRKTLKTISQLQDELQQITLLSYEPVLVRLKRVGVDVKDLRGMESSLRLYSLALKKQTATLLHSLSASYGDSLPGGDTLSRADEDDAGGGYMTELDKRAVKHRVACLQNQLDSLDKRAKR